MKKKSTKTRDIGKELIAGMREAISFHRGEITLKTTEVDLPKLPKEWNGRMIADLRINKLKVSQSILALYLGMTTSALQSWEQGSKKPSGSARRLLDLLEKNPTEILKMMGTDKLRA
jgi:putative transcriptional regulator